MNIPLCRPVTFLSTDQLQLQGLLFGNPKAMRAYIVIHGLTGSAFSRLESLAPLADDATQVLTFSNRGHDHVTSMKRTDTSEQGYSIEWMGGAHEEFTDCVHDIQGAVNFLEAQGVESMYLIGHSTGCQKSAYYLSQKPSDSVKAAALLCPVSDYADFAAKTDAAVLEKAAKLAIKLVEEGKPHELLPMDVWPHLHDAQRFLSLTTPDAIEEMFTYANPDKTPELLHQVNVPLKLVLAEQDEYWDRPVSEIADWFKKALADKDAKVTIIEGATHNLSGKEEEVRGVIKKT